MKKILIRSLLFIFIFPIFSFAQEEDESGNPQLIQDFFITESVYPQEAGEVQITLSPQYSHSETSKLIGSGLGLEYGFTDTFQLELGMPILYNKRTTATNEFGLGDMELSF